MLGFNGNRLKEMRIVRRITLEQLAHELGMTKQAVSKYEHNQSIPSTVTINKMLSILDISFKYLCKEDISYSKENSALFFRTMSATTQNSIEYADIKSRWGYEIISEMERPRDKLLNLPLLEDNSSIQQKSLDLRKFWGVGLLPISNIIELLENNGVLVFAVADNDLKTDAYSRIINGIPIIVINKSKGSAVRWRFSLAHELGHLVLHRSLSDIDFSSRSKELEDEANIFAEYFLMPPDGLKKSVISAKLDHFIPLKREWGVSIAAIIYHCNRIGIINSNKARSLQIQMSKQGWKKKEPLDNEIEFERPTLIERILSDQVKDKNSFNLFNDAVRLPLDEIEILCSLREGFFSAFVLKGDNHENSLQEYPLYEQLSFI